jgi:hypothetical protein
MVSRGVLCEADMCSSQRPGSGVLGSSKGRTSQIVCSNTLFKQSMYEMVKISDGVIN